MICSRLETLPKGWRRYIHPEGDAYWYHDGKRIVTPSNPRDPAVLGVLLTCHEQLQRQLYERAKERIPLSELYLHVTHGASDVLEARYYWADHSACQIFWSEDVACAALGLQTLDSEAEISESIHACSSAASDYLESGSRLIPEYWTHVEYFPMHWSVNQEAEDVIIGVLRHGCVGKLLGIPLVGVLIPTEGSLSDNMTSPGSTFPFSAVECSEYITVLEGFKCPYCQLCSECGRMTNSFLFASQPPA